MTDWRRKSIDYTNTFNVLVDRLEDSYQEAEMLFKDSKFDFERDDGKNFIFQEVGSLENLVESWLAARVGVVQHVQAQGVTQFEDLTPESQEIINFYGFGHGKVHDLSANLEDKYGFNPVREYNSDGRLQNFESKRKQAVSVVDSVDYESQIRSIGEDIFSMNSEEFVEEYRDDKL